MENMTGRKHLEYLGIGRMIKRYLRKIRCEGMRWVHLVQDGNQWWAFVNMVINFQVPRKAGNFLTR
jgi:hypothetical protein